MGGKKQKGKITKSLFPSNMEWWKSTEKDGIKDGTGEDDGGDTSPSNKDINMNMNMNYGSLSANNSSSGPLTLEDDGNDVGEPDNNNFPADFPECVIDMNNNSSNAQDSVSSVFGNNQNQLLDAPSDISNNSSSGNDSNSNSSDDDSSSCESGSEYEDEYDIIEQPHRAMGLLFFDFIRFVAIGANVRHVNTQMVPVFLAWGKMEVLHVALRVFMTIFSLLLILVEFPDLFPFLQHAPNSTSSSSSSSSRSTPPLYITNWIPRGIFYIFLAIICFEQSIVVRALDEARNASTSSRFFDAIFIVVSGWFMLAVGAVYILFGLFCIQRVMERVRKDEKEKWKEYYEMVQKVEVEREEAEEREWLLENGKLSEGGGHEHEAAAATINGRGRCWQRFQRWRRRCKRRRTRGQGGICYQLGCRTVDWRC